jgi:predicted transcriptional regulator
MKKELTKAEEQIMQVIWKMEKGFAKDILENIKEPKPAYNTVLTVVRVLVNKEFVGYKTYGKANEYYPLISKEEYTTKKISTLKKNYFNNSTKELLSFFMKESNLSLGDLDEILTQLKTEKDD